MKSPWRRLLEAKFDWSKFDKPTRGPLKSMPAGAVGTKMSDYEPRPEAPPEAQPESSFDYLVPIPLVGGDLSFAKSNGFKKITNWLINPQHWARGQQGEQGAINWEGTDWLRPITPAAKEFARIVATDRIRPTDVVKPDVWKRHFAHRFEGGPQ